MKSKLKDKTYSGYWKERTIIGDFTKDGFFRTGDLGHIDREVIFF